MRLNRPERVTAAEAKFGELYHASASRILNYVRRRLDDPTEVADVVAECFLIAWRRIESVPGGDEGVLWMYGVARLVVQNEDRRVLRRSHLTERLRAELAAAEVMAPDASERLEVAHLRAVLAALPTVDREAIMLTAWDGLDGPTAAALLGITPAAFRVRLHRARTRLADSLTHSRSQPGEPEPAHPGERSQPRPSRQGLKR